jgi:penicillin-binding protein 1A
MKKIKEFFKKHPRLALFVVLAIFLPIFAMGIFGITYRIFRSKLPPLIQLYNINPSVITRIYSADGKVLKEFYIERRILVPLDSMPPHLIDAVLSAEDRRFFDHWGVDLLGIFRSILVDIVKAKRVYGGSTITQQLARTLFTEFLPRKKTIPRKIKEILTALRIERAYSKKEILEMYLNQSNFGKGAYGVQAAAQAYFNKDVRELTVLDCATLVGVLPAPNRYSRVDSPEFALARRNTVLEAMKDCGKLTSAVADSLEQLPLSVDLQTNISGEAAHFAEMVRQFLEKKYGEKALYSEGLSVYTTLRQDFQKTAEVVIQDNLAKLQKNFESSHSLSEKEYTEIVADTVNGKVVKKRKFKQLQAALLAIDNRTGGILALVGGKDFTKSKFNRAIQAQRQPGSAFKPFVYAAAMDNGYNPTDVILDQPFILTGSDGKEWSPENYDRIFRGPTTLREGLKLSVNVVTIKLLQKLGPELVVSYAKRMGIKSPLQAVPSLGIGTSEVNLWELTDAFTCFPNLGIRVEPKYILKITDRLENVLEENNSTKKDEALSEQTAYVMTSMLQTVIDHGTGFPARAYGFQRPAGGKTGTTDDCMDTWFIGFIPQMTVGVWVGFDDKTKIGPDATGSSIALPIWTQFMLEATKKMPVLDFAVPSGIESDTVCFESGLLATDKCPKVLVDIFKENNAPTKYCTIHPSRHYPKERKKEEIPL